MRGLGGNPTTQVLILLDGHPQFMGLMGHHLPDAYVSSDAERVEVIRGPASFLYGSNAFGGVINIITKKQKQDGLEANARLQYGSFNTQKYMGSMGYKKKKFNVFASFNHDRTDGHRDTSDFKISNGYVKAAYRFSDHLNLFADFNLAGYETADPGMTGAPAGDRIDILRGKTSLSLENKTEKLEGALKLYYNFGDHDISDGWHSVDRMMGVMVYQGMKLFPGNMFTLGLDYMNYGGKGSPIITVLRNEDGTVIMPPTFELSPVNDTWIDMSNTGLYTTVQQQLWDQLTLNGGLRYEMNATYGNEWIPHVGISWNPRLHHQPEGLHLQRLPRPFHPGTIPFSACQRQAGAGTHGQLRAGLETTLDEGQDKNRTDHLYERRKEPDRDGSAGRSTASAVQEQR